MLSRSASKYRGYPLTSLGVPGRKSPIFGWGRSANCFVKTPSAMRSRTIKYAPFCERGFFAHFIQILMSADMRLYGDVLEHDVALSETGLRAAKPNLHSGRLRPLLQVAAIRGPRRKNFRWGKAVRPRKPDEALSRHGRCARRVAFLSPSGSPPKVFSVGQSERRSVYSVRRSIISMRDSNSIKKNEKYIPHFRRSELYFEWGRSPEGEEGEQYSHVRRLHSLN